MSTFSKEFTTPIEQPRLTGIVPILIRLEFSIEPDGTMPFPSVTVVTAMLGDDGGRLRLYETQSTVLQDPSPDIVNAVNALTDLLVGRKKAEIEDKADMGKTEP